MQAKVSQVQESVEVVARMGDCHSRLEVQEVLGDYMRKVLGISQYRLFYDEDETLAYFEDGLEKRIPRGGVAGEVSKYRRKTILNRVANNIDIYSLLPVLAVPVLSRRENPKTRDYDCLGVLEIVLKQRLNVHRQIEVFSQGQVVTGLHQQA